MESVKFFCPACRQKLSVEEEMFGTKFQCPVCNAWMKAPNGPAAAAQISPLPEKPGKPRFLLALAVGAGLGVLLLAAGFAAVWLFGKVSGQKQPDLSALPEWTPQVASSSLDSASVPDVIKEDASAVAAERTAPPAPEATVAEVVTPVNEEVKAPRAQERPKAIDVPPPQPERILSETERRKVFVQLLAADDRSRQEASRQIPDDPTQAMEVGGSLKLREKTPLYRALPPADAPQAEMEEAGKLQPGITITVAEVMPHRSGLWYRVEVTHKTGEKAGKGWVRAASLAGQSREDMDARHARQQRLQNDLLNQYHRDVEKEHGITTAQGRKILSEGVDGGWDGSKRGDITGE